MTSKRELGAVIILAVFVAIVFSVNMAIAGCKGDRRRSASANEQAYLLWQSRHKPNTNPSPNFIPDPNLPE